MSYLKLARGPSAAAGAALGGLRALLGTRLLPLHLWPEVAVVEIGQSPPLDVRLEHLLDVAHHRFVLRLDERERLAGLIHAARAPDAVRVGVHRVGDVEVDDVGDVGYVNAARRYVGRHQHVEFAVAEAVEGVLSLVLRHVALQRRRVEFALQQIARQVAGAMFGAGEDEHAPGRRLVEQRQQQVLLERARDGIQRVRHALGRGDDADLHRHRVFEDCLRQLTDFIRHGGGEEQRLPLRGQQLEDAADVGQEAHIAHAVGLVQHQHLDAREVNVSLTVQVKQAPRAGDDDLDAALQGLDLRVFAHPAVDGNGAGFGARPQRRADVVNLLGQLARGRDDQCADLAQVPAREPLENGQDEGRRLAGAGLRDAEDVASGEYLRDGLFLNGRRRGKSRRCDPRENALVERKLIETHGNTYSLTVLSQVARLTLNETEGALYHTL